MIILGALYHVNQSIALVALLQKTGRALRAQNELIN